MTQPLIHCFSGSPYTWRALIVLEEKGIPYQSNWIPRGSGAHRSEEMLAKNPRGKLPVLEWADGVTLYESIAIALFLELEKPEPALLPKHPAQRARALVRVQEADTYLEQASMEPLDVAFARKPDEPVGEAQRAANRKMFEELARWEQYLTDADGEYLAGDALSLADVASFPLIAFGVRCKLDLAERTPRLASWYERVAARPSVQASWPPHWRDTEGKDMGLNET